jgi:hypothetical protein
MESQKPAPAPRPRWTAAEEKQFQDMLDAGKTAKENLSQTEAHLSVYLCPFAARLQTAATSLTGRNLPSEGQRKDDRGLHPRG